MPASRDYYQVLGVDRRAGDHEIRRAYRRLARTYHPDVNQDPAAARRFTEISEAYEVLSDHDKRKAYDRFGRVGRGAGPETWSWSSPEGFGGGAGPDLSELFGQMFGSRGSPFATSAPAPPRGRDVHHDLSISFLTAAQGGTEELRLVLGDGAPQCLHVKIPVGIESGAKLRMKGKGHPGGNGGPAGDLIVTVTVGGHPFYRREGLDLLIDLPVTVTEAALGATVTVPLLNGSARLKLPAGASSGQKLRVKGQGISDAAGRSGDFYAVVQIVAPRALSDRARELLQALEGELKNPRETPPWVDKG